MKRFVIAFLLVGSVISTALCQQQSKIYYSAFAGAGISIFKSSIDGPTKFPTAEFRLGVSGGLALNAHFELVSRLAFGMKVKREPTNKRGQPYTITGPFIEQDEMSSYNHYFLEVPILLQYKFLHPKISIGAGLNYRQFFAVKEVQDGAIFDPLSSRKELGVIGRIAYRINSKWNVGAEQYFALTNLYGVAGSYDGEDYRMTVKNQFTQLIVEYRLSRK